MNFKEFKEFITYSCKKSIKDGKVLSNVGDNLLIENDRFVLEGRFLCPLEAFILYKGYTPSADVLAHQFDGNLNLSSIIDEQTNLGKENLQQFLAGIERAPGMKENSFYNLGLFVNQKFEL